MQQEQEQEQERTKDKAINGTSLLVKHCTLLEEKGRNEKGPSEMRRRSEEGGGQEGPGVRGFDLQHGAIDIFLYHHIHFFMYRQGGV